MRVLTILFLCFTIANCDAFLRGDNICNETVTVKRDKLVEIPVKYELKYEAICGILPCTKVRTEIRMDSKIQTTFEEVQKQVCCQGYAETYDKKCSPICLMSCKNGKCVRPNVCSCDPVPSETSPGFVGSACNRYVCLQENKWGSKCERECSSNCPSTAYCSASTGNCVCRPGWRGANCSEECEFGMMGCENIELPPIVEPEANAIDSGSINSQPRSMKLESLEIVRVDEKMVPSMFVTHGGYLMLALIIVTLLFPLIYYKRKLEQIKNELYYGCTSSSSSSSSDGGSNYTVPASIQNRPRMPTPLESDFLGKNLDFAGATRNILSLGLDGVKGAQKSDRNKIVCKPKLEEHLISSQRSSESNIYSDIESNFSDKSYTINSTNNQLCIIPENTLNVTTSSSTVVDDDDDDHAYQVPRSPTIRASFPNSCDTLSARPEVDPLIGDEDNRYDQSNLYEEIEPRSPKL